MIRPSREPRIDPALRRKIAAHLATNYDTTAPNTLKFVPSTVTEWGKLKILNGGDLIGSQNLNSRRSHGHDKTFVKARAAHANNPTTLLTTQTTVRLEVDQNHRHKNLQAVFKEQTYYGQVVHFMALQLPPTCPFAEIDPDHPRQPRALVLAAIAPIKPTPPNEFGMPSYMNLGPIEVVDASTIRCVVGRVYDRRVWTILERGTVIQTFNTTAAA
ncbi:hypothetical protein BD779DRAFT_1474489 [Infundibulicybe gibba]|nr:hypothetical protein BD779DRAFT_1474489 [Infundibulicybe gibba]